MRVEVIIPSLRQDTVERLVWSLDQQMIPPDTVTIVSNETQAFEAPQNTHARLLRFESEHYAIGEMDVALRQNVGIWSANSDIIIIQGDDQVAPKSMVADVLAAIEGKNYIWGNHRLIDFYEKTREEIFNLPASAGLSRENPVPPAWHGYYSCYGGMFAAWTPFIRDFGGFDMAFNARHGSEDQQLGYRLMRQAGQTSVEILEPPYSWHTIELKQGDSRIRQPWLQPVRNGCEPGEHLYKEDTVNGYQFMRCTNCPMLRYADSETRLFTGDIVLRYEPDLVTTKSEWL